MSRAGTRTTILSGKHLSRTCRAVRSVGASKDGATTPPFEYSEYFRDSSQYERKDCAIDLSVKMKCSFTVQFREEIFLPLGR
jgi:hypothetical protein